MAVSFALVQPKADRRQATPFGTFVSRQGRAKNRTLLRRDDHGCFRELKAI